MLIKLCETGTVFLHGDKVPRLERASRVSEVIFTVALVQPRYNRWNFESEAALRLSTAKKWRRVFLPVRHHYYQTHCKQVLLTVSGFPWEARPRQTPCTVDSADGNGSLFQWTTFRLLESRKTYKRLAIKELQPGLAFRTIGTVARQLAVAMNAWSCCRTRSLFFGVEDELLGTSTWKVNHH